MSVRIGIIGTGWVTELHLNALRTIEGAEVVAIAGRNQTQAAELAEPWKAQTYETPLRMLSSESLDAAFILLPPHLHGELERACSEHVKGVLIEKPISQSLETAQEINSYFQKAGTIVSVAYQNRYRQSSKLLGSFSPKREIKEFGQWLVDHSDASTSMVADLDQSGGQFVEQCTHILDICRFTMGEIDEVSAYSTRGFMPEVEGKTVDDAMVVNARFTSGALASFSTGCFPLGGHSESPDGGIRLHLSSRNHRVHLSGWHFDGTVYSGENNAETIPREENIFAIQDKVFLDAVATGDTSGVHSPYDDSLYWP